MEANLSQCRKSKKSACNPTDCMWKKGRKTRGKSRRSRGHCSAKRMRSSIVSESQFAADLFSGGQKSKSCMAGGSEYFSGRMSGYYSKKRGLSPKKNTTKKTTGKR